MIVAMTSRRDEIGRLARRAASGDIGAARRLVAELESRARRDSLARQKGTPGKWEVQVHYSGMLNYVVEAVSPEYAEELAKRLFYGGTEPTKLGNEWERIESIGEVHRLYDEDENEGVIEHLCEACESIVPDDYWNDELDLCAGCEDSVTRDDEASDD